LLISRRKIVGVIANAAPSAWPELKSKLRLCSQDAVLR